MHQPASRRLRSPLSDCPKAPARAWRRRSTGVAFAAALALLLGAPAGALAAAPAPPEPSGRAWILVDPADGEVLASHAASRAYPVASTTKLMTAYVARRALDPGEAVIAPGYAPSSSAESLLGLDKGERIATRDLLYGLILASGNDAAEALAIASAGSIDGFVEQMNAEAVRLGLDDTHYANPIGLDDLANYSSAADLVALTAKLREDALFRRIFDAPEATLTSGARTRQIVNRNQLVRTVPFVNGVKTGFTREAGNVLVASATQGGVTLISAVLGEPTESARDADTLDLLDHGFSLYRERQVLGSGAHLATASVADQDLTLALVAARPIELTVRRGEPVATVVDAPTEIEGPVERGAALGRVTVTVDGEPRASAALIAAASVPAASLGERIDAVVPGPQLLAWLAITALLAALGIIVIRAARGRGPDPAQ